MIVAENIGHVKNKNKNFGNRFRVWLVSCFTSNQFFFYQNNIILKKIITLIDLLTTYYLIKASLEI